MRIPVLDGPLHVADRRRSSRPALEHDSCLPHREPPTYRGGNSFSPDDQRLFMNVQSPGFTVAITGPWAKGSPLIDPIV